MLEILKQNKFILIILGIIVVGFVWYGSSDKSNATDPVLQGGNKNGPNADIERELINTLLELKSIKLDAQIFSDPVFNGLIDQSTGIVSEPIGRKNPFAPLRDVDTVTNSADEQDISQIAF